MPFRLSENRRREPAEPMKPLVDPADWTPADLAANDDWIYELSGAEISDLTDAVKRNAARGIDIKDVTREEFELPVLGKGLAALREELLNGRGFFLLRGVPVAEYPRAESALAFWGIGLHFGEALSQNAEGHLLGHVKDIGGDYADRNTRGYMSSAAMGFHSDRSDYVALMCLQPARTGGESRIASTVTLYNTLLERHPEHVAELVNDFIWTMHGEVSPGQAPWYEYPVFAFEQGWFAGRGVSTHIYKALGLDGAPADYTPKQHAALDAFKQAVQELAFDMEFRQGDIQFLHNHVTLHSRRGFEDWPEPERKRHLLRLWVYDADGRTIPPFYRENLKSVTVEGVTPSTPLDVETV
jgi:hypothetical protein